MAVLVSLQFYQLIERDGISKGKFTLVCHSLSYCVVAWQFCMSAALSVCEHFGFSVASSCIQGFCVTFLLCEPTSLPAAAVQFFVSYPKLDSPGCMDFIQHSRESVSGVNRISHSLCYTLGFFFF